VLAIKTVTQSYSPSEDVLGLLETFRRMVNQCLGIGLTQNASSLKRLSVLCYRELKGYRCLSYYKLCAISRAAGILAARKKSLRRGIPSKNPYSLKPQLVSCYGFKVDRGSLCIPLGDKKYRNIPLNKHALSMLSEPTLIVRSFTLSIRKLSLCISKEVSELICTGTVGVDRNLRPLTCGDGDKVVHYDLSKAVAIADATRKIVASFKRNDIRIRRKIASKYGSRRTNRTSQLLHHTTKRLVEDAFKNRRAIVLEDIRGLRQLYRKGNLQGRSFRARMNGWAFGEAQRQIEYKSRWIGLPLINLTRRETMGTSVTCPRCGERLQSDRNHMRELWCWKCENWMDRDVVAAVNISWRGRLRFDRSKGGAAEAAKGNPSPTVIPGVDAPKRAKLAEPKVFMGFKG
jgi:putative transposase